MEKNQMKKISGGVCKGEIFRDSVMVKEGS
jgi:hypothetical protein